MLCKQILTTKSNLSYLQLTLPLALGAYKLISTIPFCFQLSLQLQLRTHTQMVFRLYVSTFVSLCLWSFFVLLPSFQLISSSTQCGNHYHVQAEVCAYKSISCLGRCATSLKLASLAFSREEFFYMTYMRSTCFFFI